jgi:hypothetical protein
MRLGFIWTKAKSNRRIFMEHHNIGTLRILHLRSIASAEVKLDLLHPRFSCSATLPFGCSDYSISVLLAPLSKGQRFIVVHAGSDTGLVPSTCTRIKLHPTTGDCTATWIKRIKK